MMVPLWVVGVGSAVFLGMFIREILLNNELEEKSSILAQYLGYMMLRFDYTPTWEDIANKVGIEDKIEKMLKEQEEEES